MTTWQRLEGLCRSEALSGGLEARVADPLWMLARQWQVGELRGDDAARPVGVSLSTRSLPLATLSKGTQPGAMPLPAAVPLEYLVEQIAEPTTGEAGLHSAARLGHRLLRMLGNAGLEGAREPLIAKFTLVDAQSPLAATGLMAQTAALFTGRALDGRQVLIAKDEELRTVLGTALDDEQIEIALVVIGRWRTWGAACGALLASDGWDGERLEYSFAVAAEDRAGPLELTAAEHTGGDLDWFSFELAAPVPGETPPKPLPTRAPVERQPVGELRTLTSLPAPVQYRGQPAARWWEFENGSTNFADIDAGPADLARLVVTEFAVAFSNDWFVIPARLPVGSVTDVLRMRVVDNFGGQPGVQSVAAGDDGPKTTRPWRMFELTGDELTDEHRSPWLLILPTVVGDLTGAPLERVSLVRDEGANLVWGIEKLVEGPAGRALDRATLGSGGTTASPAPTPSPSPTPSPTETPAAPLSYADQVWKYRLESKVPPPFWIPFLPERLAPKSAEIRLRRARMQQWEESDVTAPGPHGVVLDAGRPCWIREEEVPRSGIRVDRRWRYARGDDGIGHVWLQLEKAPGRGERSSGVRWDVIEITSAAP